MELGDEWRGDLTPRKMIVAEREILRTKTNGKGPEPVETICDGGQNPIRDEDVAQW